MLADLHIGFSIGRSSGLVFLSLSEFSTVYCDPRSPRLWHSQESRNRCFFWNSLAFSSSTATAKSLHSCPTLCDPRDSSPPGFPVSGILQARTFLQKWQEVGCHFLLQCMKGKSESEVTQSCLTLSNPRDCSLPGSSVHGIFQARVLE